MQYDLTHPMKTGTVLDAVFTRLRAEVQGERQRQVAVGCRAVKMVQIPADGRLQLVLGQLPLGRRPAFAQRVPTVQNRHHAVRGRRLAELVQVRDFEQRIERAVPAQRRHMLRA